MKSSEFEKSSEDFFYENFYHKNWIKNYENFYHKNWIKNYENFYHKNWIKNYENFYHKNWIKKLKYYIIITIQIIFIY